MYISLLCQASVVLGNSVYLYAEVDHKQSTFCCQTMWILSSHNWQCPINNSKHCNCCAGVCRRPCTLLSVCYLTSIRICMHCMAPCPYERTNTISRKYPAACATNYFWQQSMWFVIWYTSNWWRGTVVERRSLAGELSLSCARPAADGWPLMWVSHPL